jgi:hypothetical protein
MIPTTRSISRPMSAARHVQAARCSRHSQLCCRYRVLFQVRVCTPKIKSGRAHCDGSNRVPLESFLITRSRNSVEHVELPLARRRGVHLLPSYPILLHPCNSAWRSYFSDPCSRLKLNAGGLVRHRPTIWPMCMTDPCGSISLDTMAIARKNKAWGQKKTRRMDSWLRQVHVRHVCLLVKLANG